MSRLKKHWGDPVWSTVIATGIVALLGLIITYFLNWWPSILQIVGDIWDYAFQKTSIANWFYWLLGLNSAVVGYLLVRFAWNVLTARVQPTWRDYTKDDFLGLTWSWHYFGDGNVQNLHSLCQKCLYQVYPRPTSGYSTRSRFEYCCDSCGNVVGPFDEDPIEIESKVTRYIQQKLRTETWSNAKTP